MGIGGSIFLIALGAILAFAVTTTVSGVDLHTVGWILMAVGAIGLLGSFLWAQSLRRRAYADPYVEREVVATNARPVVREYR